MLAMKLAVLSSALGVAAVDPLPCQPASLHPWPIFHIVNNVTTITLQNGEAVAAAACRMLRLGGR